MSVRGIIFDLDGTLLDTLPGIAAAINAGRAAFGLGPWPVADIKNWIGEGLPILCRRALADAPQVPAEQMVPLVSEYYADHLLDQVAAFPGVAELLDELTARGMPLAILSNKPHRHTVPMATALLSRWPFVAVEGYQQEEFRKPDPRVALDIVSRMKLTPEDVSLVGDSDTDMRTAVNAGLVPVGVTWGYRTREVIQQAGATHLIDTPGDLLKLVG